MNPEQSAFGGGTPAPFVFADDHTITARPLSPSTRAPSRVASRAPTPAPGPFNINTATDMEILVEIYSQILLIRADVANLTYEFQQEVQARTRAQQDGQNQFNNLVGDIGVIDGRTTRIEHMLHTVPGTTVLDTNSQPTLHRTPFPQNLLGNAVPAAAPGIAPLIPAPPPPRQPTPLAPIPALVLPPPPVLEAAAPILAPAPVL